MREYTPQEAAILAGANLGTVQKALTSGALPIKRRNHRRFVDASTVLTLAAAAKLGRIKIEYRLLRAAMIKLLDTHRGELQRIPPKIDPIAMEGTELVKLDPAPILGVIDSMRLYDHAIGEVVERKLTVKGGSPVVRGTRLSVHALLGRVEDGDSVDDILKDYPYLSRQALDAALLYARANPLRGRPKDRPWRKRRKPTRRNSSS